jgi:type IV pilus assembly protein PilA
MKTFSKSNLIAKGFSLVEMLVVIAVIGVIAAIAIPNLSNINGAAKVSKDQRNAQSIVSMFQSGSSAGVAWVTASRNAAVADVITGRAPTDGAFNGKTFVVPNVGATDLTNAAYQYIGLDVNGNLFYDKSGAQAGS